MSRRIAHVVFLTTIWVLLWGDLSAANVASGVLLSVLLMVLFPSGASTLRVSEAVLPSPDRSASVRPAAGLGGRLLDVPRRISAWAHLIGHVLVQLVVSNGLLSREILTRRSRIRTGIVACPLRVNSERTVTFVANVLSLSPGTMPIEVQIDPPVIYVHVLHLDDPADTRRAVARLELLTLRAFGVSDDAIGSVVPTDRVTG